ncbi:MAG: YraN family protein [Proteobacteria bacterium]|jgi:putative endonuclease|nr:YraN family protein [Pseudomonadota bacterium]
MASGVRQARGTAARKVGRRAEVIAALWLMAKGYRILGFRLATPLGEIDLLAQRGKVLAVIEVKQRRTIEEALDAVKPTQRERLRRAAAHLSAHRAGLRDLLVRLDLIAIAPRRPPRHLPDAWRGA